MDGARFDAISKTLAARRSRRVARRPLIGSAIAIALGRLGLNDAAAKKKKRKKKPTPNAYGCLNIGQPCRGKDALCCSGVCKGKKPKKGKKDKRKCAAHNTGGCIAAQDTCAVNKNVPCLSNGACTVTTGEATFCAKIGFAICMECARDADCSLMAGPGAACIVCPVLCPQSTTACVAAAA